MFEKAYKNVLLIGMISFVMSLPFIQCLGDDTFIYMRAINHFIENGQFEYNSGEPCYCMTSLTWFMAWSELTALFKNIDIARYLISLLSHIFAVIVIYLLAQKYIKNKSVLFITIAVILFDSFYIRWLWGGWELSFKIAMAALCIYGLTEIHDSGKPQQFLYTGIWVGLGILTRPELIFLGLVGFIYLILKYPGKYYKYLLYLLGCGVILIPWFIFAHHEFGWILPHTIFAKTGKESSVFDIQYLVFHGIKLLKIIVIPQLILYLLLLYYLINHMVNHINLFQSFKKIEKHRLLDYGLIAIWAVTVFGYYVTGTYISSIRTGLFSPFIALILGILIDNLLSQSTGKLLNKSRTVLLISLVMLVSLGVQIKLYYQFSIFNRRYLHGDDQKFIDFALKVKELTKPSDTIGLHELGVIGYYSERYIYDFAGLGTADIVSYKLKYKNDPIGQFFKDKGEYSSYIVWQYGKGFDAGMEDKEQVFFEQKYMPIYDIKVKRIGGINSRDHYDLYILYKHVTE